MSTPFEEIEQEKPKRIFGFRENVAAYERERGQIVRTVTITKLREKVMPNIVAKLKREGVKVYYFKNPNEKYGALKINGERRL